MRLQNDRCQNSSVIDPSSVIAPAFTPNRLNNTKQESAPPVKQLQHKPDTSLAYFNNRELILSLLGTIPMNTTN